MTSTNHSISNWDFQIELFARYFIVNARLSKNKQFSLLDVGCGTGTALRIIRDKYPLSKLYGCDIEPKHISLSRDLNNKYGNFFVSDIEGLNSHFDYIYLSNVLEHLTDWEEQLRLLLDHADRIYLLVPFKEKVVLNESADLDNSHHINSFDEYSFEYLRSLGFTLDKRVITTPYAWGSGPIHNLLNKYNLFKNKMEYKREILVCISSKEKILPKPFYPILFSFFKKGFSILLPIYFKKYFMD